MAKKKQMKTPEFSKKIMLSLGKVQRNWEQIKTLVPLKPTSILTPAQSHGPDLEFFRTPEHALDYWKNKQLQTWLFFGNLVTSTGRVFYFQTHFNIRNTQNDYFGFVPTRILLPHYYHAQFAITDAMNANSKKVFRSFERAGVLKPHAGHAAEDRFHIEIDGWYARKKQTGNLALYASSNGVSVHLNMTPSKPLLYPAQQGYFQKGADSDFSSYYCSYPQMSTKGTLLIDGKLHDVTGVTCLDHEKLSYPDMEWLSQESDRISIFFNNSEELILHIFYDRYGHPNVYSFGSYIDREGHVHHLIHSDFKIQTTQFWKSESTLNRYPIRKEISIESLGLKFEIKPVFENQELKNLKTDLHGVWSGPIAVSGTKQNSELNAFGFLRLCGYDKRKHHNLIRKTIKVKPQAAIK